MLSGGYFLTSDHTEVLVSQPDQDSPKWDVTVRLTADAQQPPTALVEVLCAKTG